MKRGLCVPVCLLLWPLAAFGQKPENSWENISGLRPGQKVEVVEMNLKKSVGSFVSVSPETLVIRVGDSEASLPRASVMRVSNRENSRRLRNALIGAAVGAGAMAGAGAAAAANDDGYVSQGGAAAIFGVVGLVAGGGIGAAIPSYATIYRAPKP